MNYRDFLQKVIYVIINPLIKGMIKIGITPNFITTTGFLLNVVATAMFIYAVELPLEEAKNGRGAGRGRKEDWGVGVSL